MTKDEAISFLLRNQPMPNDSDLSEELIRKYNDVRKYFLNNPSKECIPLFLNSFGERSGFGAYQLVEDVLKKYSKDEVIPHLIKALSSKHRSVRYWCAEIAVNFVSPEILPSLSELLHDSDSDIRYASITALEQFDRKQVDKILRDALSKEDDEEIRRLLLNVLAEKV